MGLFVRRCSASFISRSFVRMRSRRDFLLIRKSPRRVLSQMSTNPRNVKVSGLASPRFLQFCAAKRPNSIRRVLSGWSDSENSFSLSRISDDVVDTRLGRPSDLLLEHRAHLPVRVCVPGFENVGVGDVTRDQRAAFSGDFLGDGERGAVNWLEIALPVDQAQFFPMRIISEGLNDVGSCAQEIARSE